MDNNSRFIFNEPKLIDNLRGYNKLGIVYYPVKANSNKVVLKSLNKLFDRSQNGFLISNLSHYKTLRKIGISPKKMCLINVLTTKDSLKFFYKKGIRFFAFDDLESLMNFSMYADLKKVKISIRLNIVEVFDNIVVHMGARLNECIKMINFLKNKCDNIGISFYLQSKVKYVDGSLERILDYIEENFSGYDISFISMAGLKGYNYINQNVLLDIKKKMNLKEIILEPGNNLIGDTIDLVTSIIRYRKINKNNLIVLKNGLYSGFLDASLYNKKFDLYLKTTEGLVKFNSYKKDVNDVEIIIFGGSSDSEDIIGKYYLPKIHVNENIENKDVMVKNIGAYFQNFFMEYGGCLAKDNMEVKNNEI